jgi:uncharacterized protein (TIGR02301 family)
MRAEVFNRGTGVTRFRFAAAAMALVLVGAPLAAPAQEIIPVPPSNEAVAPPYDDGLLRLSEILGAIHYLRELCKANEGSLWRDQMQALIDAEQPDQLRRARFVDRFNRGYESFKSVYVTCTPAATLAIDRYIKEGSRIARDIAARYGKEE